MQREEAERMGIRDVRVWWNVEETERRIYVHVWDGREGCKYMTGNRWAAKGSTDVKLTAEEWQAAWTLAQHTNAAGVLKWGDYRAPKPAPAAVATPAATDAAQTPERPVVATFAESHRPSCRVGGPLTDDTGHVFIVQRVRYLRADPDNERDDPQWVIECVEPTAAESTSEAVQRAQRQAQEAKLAREAREASERFRFELEMRNTNGYGN